MLNIVKYHQKYDILRGIAALTVLFAHVIQVYIRRLYIGDEIIFDISGTLANHAVMIFFLLSGYLITASIIGNIKYNEKFDYIAYLKARVIRIYPPLIGAILLVLFCWALIHGLNLPGKFYYGISTDTLVVRDSFNLKPRDILLALAMRNGMLQADGPLWSLSLEFILYVIAMFTTLAIVAKTLASRLAWITIAILVFVYGMTLNTQFSFFALVWLGGSLSAIANSMNKLDKVTFYGRTSIIITLVSLFVLAIVNPRLISVQNINPLSNTIVRILFCFLYLYLMFMTNILDGIKSEFFIKSVSYSYSLYIIHFPILLLIYSFTQNWMGGDFYRTLLISCFAVITSVVGASVFARYFENKTIFKSLVCSAFNLLNLRVINK